ncbi:cyanophycin synthetase [Actinotignum timonense]|nr:cyanophycin synthetase [Actinotignum timonense]
MDVFRRGSTLIIDDSYNANPDSMRAGIAALGQLGSGLKAAILGDIRGRDRGEVGEVANMVGAHFRHQGGGVRAHTEHREW